MGFGQDGPAMRNPGPTRHSPENCSISVRRELRFGPGKERLMNVVARNCRADGIDKGSGSDRLDPPCIAGSGLPGVCNLERIYRAESSSTNEEYRINLTVRTVPIPAFPYLRAISTAPAQVVVTPHNVFLSTPNTK